MPIQVFIDFEVRHLGSLFIILCVHSADKFFMVTIEVINNLKLQQPNLN